MIRNDLHAQNWQLGACHTKNGSAISLDGG
ncbi:hypothetical protein V6Z11_A01G068200 [Gossypium hirsutum]